jgi:hypothetical protein
VSHPSRPRLRPEPDGSAYLVAILALALLTGVGLVTALIAQSEMLIGANERAVQGLFYAAESGLAASLARALANDDYTPAVLDLPDRRGGAVSHRVETSTFQMVLSAPCNLCEVGAPDYGASRFRRLAFAVTARARRDSVGGGLWSGAAAQSTVIEVQPWPPPSATSVWTEDPGSAKEIEL